MNTYDSIQKHSQAEADIRRQLKTMARRGVGALRVDSLPAGDREIVGGKIWADPSTSPNDAALETLARMVVDSSNELKAAGWRSDSGETLLFSNMLKHIVAKAVPTLYLPNVVRSTFPIDNSIPSGAATVSLRRVFDHDDDDFGALSGRSGDIVEVNLGAEEEIYRLQSFGRAFSWSLDELEAAAFANVQLSTEGLAALNRAAERIFEKVSLAGYDPAGLVGCYNDANVTITAAVTGTWGTPATHDQIVADCRALIEAVYLASGQSVRPNRLVIPAGSWKYMSVRRAETDLNVLTALKQDYPNLEVLESSSRADTYDAAGTGPRMMAFSYNPEFIRVAEARRFALEAPERNGFNFRVAGRQKLGGALIAVPLTCGYMDIA